MAKQVLVQSSNDDISRADAWHAFKLLRKQAADVPEMSLDEINAEIAFATKKPRVIRGFFLSNITKFSR